MASIKAPQDGRNGTTGTRDGGMAVTTFSEQEEEDTFPAQREKQHQHLCSAL